MPNQDFIIWSPGEEDPNNHITVTANKVDFVDLTRDEDAWHVDDKGVNFYSGDWEHLAQWKIISMYTSHNTYIHTLANIVDDAKGIYDASGDFQSVLLGDVSGVLKMVLVECDGGSFNTSTQLTLNYGTDYWDRFKRVESIGPYGTNYEYIFSDEDLTLSVGSKSIALLSSKKDFRYKYAVQTYNSGHAWLATGYIQNMDLQEAVASSRRGIGRGIMRGIGRGI